MKTVSFRSLSRPPVVLSLLLLGGACGGPRAAGPSPAMAAAAAPDEPLIRPEDSGAEPPARGEQRPPPSHLPDPPRVREDPSPVEAPAVPAPDPVQTGRVAYAGPRGTIHRAELVRMLDQSPALFLRRVDSEPRFEGGRFRGWHINAFFPEDVRFSGIDLRRGDVVTRINGQPIEQPDQFIVVWQGLRQARELRVDLLRNGQPHVSRWSIVD